MSKENGGPAFPINLAIKQKDDSKESVIYSHAGMTLRDYFAAHAISQIIKMYADDNKCGIGTDHLVSNCAIHAYRIADAMLLERNK